jgi:hypothetical protein
MLAAIEDPIVGLDQRSTEYQVKPYNNFCDLDPSPGEDHILCVAGLCSVPIPSSVGHTNLPVCLLLLLPPSEGSG